MWHHIALPVILPALIVQGLRVRRDTLRLPEPAGARTGTTENGHPPLSLLVAGDSAGAGVGVAHQSQALAGQLVHQLYGHFDLHWHLQANTGDTLKDLLHQLQQLPPQPFNVVVVSIGVNNVVNGTSRRQWQKQLHQMVGLLRTRFNARSILLTSIPPMQYFPALPQPLAWFLGQRAAVLNRAMQAVCCTCTTPQQAVVYFQVDFELDPKNIAADGFHPGAPAYVTWAQAIARWVITHEGRSATI